MRKATLFFILLFILATVVPAAASAPVGSISYTKGTVTVSVGGQPPQTVEKGGNVFEGDTFTTGENSYTGMVFTDGSMLQLSPDTKVTISKFVTTGNQQSVIRLVAGIIQSRVIKEAASLFGFKSKHRYEVHTPNAIIGVRGTNFITGEFNGLTESYFIEGTGYGFPKNLPSAVLDIGMGLSFRAADPDTPAEVGPPSQTMEEVSKTVGQINEKLKELAEINAYFKEAYAISDQLPPELQQDNRGPMDDRFEELMEEAMDLGSEALGKMQAGVDKLDEEIRDLERQMSDIAQSLFGSQDEAIRIQEQIEHLRKIRDTMQLEKDRLRREITRALMEADSGGGNGGGGGNGH